MEVAHSARHIAHIGNDPNHTRVYKLGSFDAVLARARARLKKKVKLLFSAPPCGTFLTQNANRPFGIYKGCNHREKR